MPVLWYLAMAGFSLWAAWEAHKERRAHDPGEPGWIDYQLEQLAEGKLPVVLEEKIRAIAREEAKKGPEKSSPQ